MLIFPTGNESSHRELRLAISLRIAQNPLNGGIDPSSRG
jgi:hypothetical protein